MQSKTEQYTWRRVTTFGTEGTEAGNFCRPWGVAIARYSDLSTLCDSWSFNGDDEEGATSASSSDTFNEWSSSIGLGFINGGFNGIESIVGSNNNRTITSGLSPAWSTYLIGIADRSNNRVQLFKFDAIKQTVTFLHKFGEGPGARHGQFDRPAGIVFNPKLEQIIVADKDNHRVQVFDMSGSYLFKFGERGSKCGQFCYPWDIDICKTTQNIIVSDTRNRRIQMFNNLGRYLTHFSQPLDSPRGVTFLSSTQVMVSDFNKHRLLMITSQQNFDDKIVSSSTTNSILSHHDMIGLNPNPMQQYQQQHQLPPITAQRPTARQIIQQLHESKFVGFGEGSSWGEFLRPQGVTCNGSTVYCSDSRNNRVACWSKETSTFDYMNRDVVELDRPAGLAAIDDYIVIVDFGNNRVHICQRQIPINGYPFDDMSAQTKPDQFTWRRVVTFGTEGTEAGNFCRPWGVAIARYSDLSTLCDSWSFNGDDEGATSASSSDTFNDWSRGLGFINSGFNGIESIVGSNNNRTITSGLSPAWSTYLIGIADRSNNRVQLFKFDAIKQTVTFLHKFGEGPGARHGQFDRPAGIVFNPKLEQIIVADKDNHRVQVFDMSGSYLFKFGERGSKCGQFCYPWDIDVCKTTHNIVVSDTRNRRIQMFNNLGRYLTHFSQPLDSPRGVTFLSSTQVMVSDFNKHRLLMITSQQNFDDKIVSSSTTNSILSHHDMIGLNPNPMQQYQQQHQLPPITAQRPTARQIIQQLHESKFVGFGEGSSWGEFLRPQGITCNESSIYCSDSRNNRVACWNKETQTFNYLSRDVVELDRPAGLAAIDDYIVIVDFGNNRVHICQRHMQLNEYPFDITVQSRNEL